MTLISTKDLLTMDSLNSGMVELRLGPHSSPRSTPKYLESGAAPHVACAPSHDPLAPTNAVLLASSPSPVSVHGQSIQSTSASPSPSHAPGTRPRASHLAPDRYGKEIPLDAQWTRIKRTLVSPEVLERAGVRYEARPDYVAVLGRLTREQIAEYARQSAECRAARSGQYPPLRHQTSAARARRLQEQPR